MVTDGLCPIVTRDGVGTIITLQGRDVLTEGLEFHKMEIRRDEALKGEQWMIRVDAVPTPDRIRNSSIKIYLTSDALLKTPDGWRHPEELKHGNLVKAYFIHCLVCQKLYLPSRPIISTCGEKCLSAAKNAELFIFKPLNQQSVYAALEEKWAYITSSSDKLNVQPGMEVVRVNKIENACSVYCGGVLLSTDSLQAGYNSPTE
jgi:hypothetical protein